MLRTRHISLACQFRLESSPDIWPPTKARQEQTRFENEVVLSLAIFLIAWTLNTFDVFVLSVYTSLTKC